jgi:predicted ATPase/DNA-binding SARP family transcriptional activator
MTLKIRLLGQFKLEHLDVPLELPSRPAQSLFAYLVLNPDISHRREKLAGLIWPDSDETNARNYLRQALWRIRKSLEGSEIEWEQYLKIDRINVSFDSSSDHWLDASLLLRQAETPAHDELIEAAAAYQGELLPGFYDEWIGIERDRLNAAYHQKMNLLLQELRTSRAWDQVLEWGEQWIRFGNSPEPAFRAVMEAYAELGQTSMIRTVYERCCEALERELGLEPSAATRSLLERLEGSTRDVERKPDVAVPSWSPMLLEEAIPDPAESPAFVAREAELAQLGLHLQSALQRDGRVVFVMGDAGSGKTALLKEFTHRALEEYPALIVASGNCNAQTGMGDPYLPLREILGMLTGDVEARSKAGGITRDHALRLWNILPETARIMVECGQGLIDTFVSGTSLLQRTRASMPDETGWQAELQNLVAFDKSRLPDPVPVQNALFEQYTRVLQTLSRHVPLMLVLDDLQWADTGTIGLLFHISRQLAGCPILIVGAYRREEVAAGRRGERHPLEAVIHEIQREYGAISVDLSDADQRAFVDAILDSEPNRLDPPFREMLYRQTHGHPLFTVELLRGMQERGDLKRDDQGCWFAASNLDWETMPARVEAVVAERIARLDPQLQAILQTASVEGEVFTAEVISRILGVEEGKMLSLLSNELDRKHRLISAESIQRVNGHFLSRYRFRHILFQKYMYSSLDEIEKTHLHERVGANLESLYESGEELLPDALQLARQFEQAGDIKKTIRYLYEAGKRAIQLSAYEDGSAHLCKGLELLSRLPKNSARDELELRLQLEISLTWKYNWGSSEGIKAIERTSELCRQMEKPAPMSRAMGELATYHYVKAEYKRAVEYAREALRLARQADDPLLVAEGHWLLGLLHFCLGDYLKASDHLGEISEFYVPEEHHHAIIRLRGVDSGLSAMAYHACCLWCLGYPDQALERSQQAISLARKFNHPFTLADVLCYAGCMFNAMYRDAQALNQHAEQLVQLSNEKLLSLSGWLGMGTCFQGSALAMLGRPQKAIKEIRTGIAISEKSGIHLYRPVALRFLAAAQMENGQAREGLESLVEAISLVEEIDDRNWEADLYRLQGECLAILGDIAEAENSLRQALDIARKQNAKSWELRASISLARLWQQAGKRDQARKLMEEILSWFTEGSGTPDHLEARRLLGELS